MHFLSTGRDARVQRWIAGQYPERPLAPGETDVVQWLDSLESVHRKDHDAIVDMDWELEELERQIALTTFERGREHGPTSMLSVDSMKSGLDVTSTKQAPQLTDESLETQGEVEHEASSEASPRTFDRRREGRIMSQPFVLPPHPADDPLLPPPSLQRSRTIPPPINTDKLGRGSFLTAPPITFILQESASPLPSAMHFTPTPLDLEAFPSTPRSFGSFAPDLRSSEERARPPPELFLSPRLPNEHPKSTPPLSTPSPVTPYSPYSVTSGASSFSLSAFPSTPHSPFPRPSYFTSSTKGVGENGIPPVPALPPPKLASISPSLSMNRDKPLPSVASLDSAPSRVPPSRKRSATLPSLPAPPVRKLRRAYSSAGTRSRSGSLTTSRAGTPSRSNSRTDAFSRAISRAETLSRANSRAGTHSRASSRSGQHCRTGSAFTRAHTIQEQEQEQPQGRDAQMHTPPSTPSPPPMTSVRTLIRSMSRVGHGIKRSVSQSSQAKPQLTIHTRRPSLHAPAYMDNWVDGNQRSEGPGVPSMAPVSARRRFPMTPATPSSVPIPPTPVVTSAKP
ncbi:hypothetical protein JB92DRAFT_415494 [Gautieria morchelliformis]|nr:hypothetical protein JB92DRAFT_415494 [Gautieria morchelliformis]